MTENIDTPEVRDRLWNLVLAKVDELVKACPGNQGTSRSAAMLDSDKRGLSALLSIYQPDGTCTVYHVKASVNVFGSKTHAPVTVSRFFHNCEDHWEKVIRDDAGKTNVVIVDHRHYAYFPDRTPRERAVAGFAGRRFRIRFHDGREVETRNLWAGGVIPPIFRDRLPDNAVFLNAEGDPTGSPL